MSAIGVFLIVSLPIICCLRVAGYCSCFLKEESRRSGKVSGLTESEKSERPTNKIEIAKLSSIEKTDKMTRTVHGKGKSSS